MRLSSLSRTDEAKLRTRMQPVLKDVLAKYFIEAWSHLSVTQNELKLLKQKDKESCDQIRMLQNETIRLQGELIASKDEQLQQLKSAVENSVKTSVQQEIKSYSDAMAATSIQPEVSTESIKKVIRTVAEDEARATNLMVFGLPEESTEDLSASIGEVFSEMDEKPKFEAFRIGVKIDSDTHVRPVMVKLRNRATTQQLLKKASALRKVERFKRVYVSPDRTPEQRIAHQKLVTELRDKSKNNPERDFVIRNGAVISIDRGG